MQLSAKVLSCTGCLFLIAAVINSPSLAHPGGGGGGSHGGGGFHGGGSHAGGFHGGGYHGGGYHGGWRGGGYGHRWLGGRFPGGWGGAGYGLFYGGLPWYYDTYFWDGVPYYYGDDAYYAWNGDAGGYETVDPPARLLQEVKAQGPLHPVFMYPKAGQSSEQQARDRQECVQWATQQSGYDPNAQSAAPSGAAASSPKSDGSPKPSDFLRAERACLEARNYSVG